MLALNHRLRSCRVTHLFNLWSFFTGSCIFAPEPKCNFCFIPSSISPGVYSAPLPSVGSQAEMIPYSPLADGASGSVCFQSCVSEWCSGDPAAPPSLTASPVMFLCWPLSSMLHGKIPVQEKWWRTTNQWLCPLTPRLKPHPPPQMSFFTSNEAFGLAPLFSVLYAQWRIFFFFTVSHLFIFNGFPGDFERLVVTYCLSLFRYLASTEMWKWRKTFILGHFWVTVEQWKNVRREL